MAELTTYTAYLSPTSIENLELLLACSDLPALHCPVREVRDSVYVVESISVQFQPDLWLIFRSEWDDTPQFYTDYYQLSIEIANEPRDVAMYANMPLQQTTIPVPPGAITRITVMEMIDYHETDGVAERVCYDHAILLDWAGGQQVCISAHVPSIIEYFEVTSDPEATADALNLGKPYGQAYYHSIRDLLGPSLPGHRVSLTDCQPRLILGEPPPEWT